MRRKKGDKAKPNLSDFAKGAAKATLTGRAMNPMAVNRMVNKEAEKRERREGKRRTKAEKARRLEAHSLNFGDGESLISRGWTSPVHATLEDGTPVTVSWGVGPRSGHYLLAQGHKTMHEFMTMKEHDHYKGGDLPKDRGYS